MQIDYRQILVNLGQMLTGQQTHQRTFYHSITLDTLAASPTATGQFVVDNDGDFVICKTTFLLSEPVAGTEIAIAAGLLKGQPFGSGLDEIVPFLVTLSTLNFNFSDGPLPLDNVFGTGQHPFEWPVKQKVAKASSFTASVQNLNPGAITMRLRLIFIGYKVFPYQTTGTY